MKTTQKKLDPLYAIYREGKHLGNCREKNSASAINRYLIDAGYSKNDSLDIKLLSKYSTTIAVEDIHYSALSKLPS